MGENGAFSDLKRYYLYYMRVEVINQEWELRTRCDSLRLLTSVNIRGQMVDGLKLAIRSSYRAPSVLKRMRYIVIHSCLCGYRGNRFIHREPRHLNRLREWKHSIEFA